MYKKLQEFLNIQKEREQRLIKAIKKYTEDDNDDFEIEINNLDNELNWTQDLILDLENILNENREN